MNRTSCLSCSSEQLVEILDLGMHPFADRFVPTDRAFTPDAFYPLVCDLCERCGLVQSRTVTDPADRYKDYSYTSSNSASTRKHWDEYARDVSAIVGLKPGARIIEAGSNDGYLCAAFRNLGFAAVGIDPSPEMAALATARGIGTKVGFFNGETVQEIAEMFGRADLVVANNVLNHADDLRGFVEAARAVLSEHGTFVFQVPYWRRTVESFNFDQVYHEHVSYLTVTAARYLLRSVGMSITRVDEVDFHGRSLRIFATPSADSDPASVTSCTPNQVLDMMSSENLVLRERSYVDIRRTIFAKRCAFLRRLYSYDDDVPVVCAGAAAKGNTFLNWHRLDRSVVSFVTDISPTKIGKLTPGSRIPIVHDEELVKLPRARVIVTSWNLAKSIRESLSAINPNLEFIDPHETPR